MLARGGGGTLGQGGAAFALATDIGGSIRYPAAFCGVVGHKPSGGYVPTTGDYPTRPSPKSCMMNTIGPICRLGRASSP